MYRIALAISKAEPDCIIAVGGGSTIDAAKAASVLASYERSEIEPYFGTGKVTDELITPPAAAFDYRATLSAPRDLTLDGALDGIAHCWEVYRRP